MSYIQNYSDLLPGEKLSLSRKKMHQSPDEQTSRLPGSPRTRSALSHDPLPTMPVYVSANQRQNWPQMPERKPSRALRRSILLLCFYGLLLGLCFWLMYPLLAMALPGSAAARVLTTAFPWLPRLFWTNLAPFLVSALASAPWLDLRAGVTLHAINLLLVLLALVCGLFFLAADLCRRLVRAALSQRSINFFLLMVCLFALLFGLIFVFLPGGIAQNALLSALYGRLIALYHVNPYLANSGVFVHDSVYPLLAPSGFVSPHIGPLWLDLTVPLAWLTSANPAFVLPGFRLAGLLFHMMNIVLIWTLLTKLKPEVRLSGTLLYAWNPLLLLLGVGEAYPDLAAIFFLLLGVVFLQRRVLLVGWVCLLLAALINPLCLLIVPLFLRGMARETRSLQRGQRTLWWISLLLLSALVVTLAYAPYWSGLGINGIAQRLGLVFWQETAQHSLLFALQQLPFASWPLTSWLLLPHNWLLLVALLVAGLLLLGCWISDTLELALLFSSWIFLAVFVLLPMGSPWLLMIPLTLALASASRRTSLLAHLLGLGALLAYVLLLANSAWSGQALITIGLPLLVWGWTLFFLSTWHMTHPEEEQPQPAPQFRKRLGISRPSWPSRPSAWPSRSSRPGWRG
ncbi:MAG TPA: hypothetical protein VFN35_22415 [Ktedonobacteraceae bacterium]|nr:hypothetical protein [Ktedonobacteraceae bacterium]